ncbi:APC family permease [Cesiribacter andamanensis]|uniref:Arginine/agmatine antiporter n=1 Tax=Cesiribacter andamanensis AMV16 TaxID=1279009 RepID=M7NAE9_9BACT|nr:APC family permease [Cesiribacter andamanensis]EMR04227.1 Serine/threonine exchanger SteT [Cesiribacter andamanensis AMV16]
MLKREISRWDLVLLLINSLIGAGIFGLPSKIFAQSGIYSLAALLVCALIVLLIVLMFAEVASRFDQTGGPYRYVLAAFGRLPAFVVGWLILITRVSTYAALIHLLVTYLAYFMPLFEQQTYRCGAIIGITGLLSWVNHRGVRSATLLSNGLAISKILPLLLFCGMGLFFLDADLLTVPPARPALSDFSASVLVLIFAFTGFEAVLVNTGEVQQPRRSIPFALLVAILFVAVFYGLIQLVSIGTLPELATSEKPITEAAQRFMGPWGAALITLGAIVSIGGTLNAVMLIGSRLPYALSLEGQFPQLFTHLHPKNRTPTYSLLVFSGVSLLASLTGSFIYAVSISVISKVLIFLLVCGAMLPLRKKGVGNRTYFRLPWGGAFAISGVVASIALLASARAEEFVDVLMAVGLGLGLYGLYLLRSRLRH